MKSLFIFALFLLIFHPSKTGKKETDYTFYFNIQPFFQRTALLTKNNVTRMTSVALTFAPVSASYAVCFTGDEVAKMFSRLITLEYF